METVIINGHRPPPLPGLRLGFLATAVAAPAPLETVALDMVLLDTAPPDTAVLDTALLDTMPPETAAPDTAPLATVSPDTADFVVPSAEPATPVEEPVDALAAARAAAGVTGATLHTVDGQPRLRVEIADDADPVVTAAHVLDQLEAAGVAGAEVVTPKRAALPRVILQGVRVATVGLETGVEVSLSLDGPPAVGRASGPAIPAQVLKTAAAATSAAVHHLLGDAGRCAIEHADALDSAQVALVVVVLLTTDGPERLAGCAPLGDDPPGAIVRATLDALNRRLGRLLSQTIAKGPVEAGVHAAN